MLFSVVCRIDLIPYAYFTFIGHHSFFILETVYAFSVQYFLSTMCQLCWTVFPKAMEIRSLQVYKTTPRGDSRTSALSVLIVFACKVLF